MIHLLPLALAKAKWKIPGFEESSSDSIVAERIVSATIPRQAETPAIRVAKTYCNDPIKSLAIPFRNYAHRLRARFDQRTGHDGSGLRAEGGRPANAFSGRKLPGAAGIVPSCSVCSTISAKGMSWSSGSWTAYLGRCGMYSRSWSGLLGRKRGSAASQRQSTPRRQPGA